MACGLAVVTTVVGDMGEYVASGRNALTVPPRDPEALRDALKRLLEDYRLRSALGEAGVRTAEQYSNCRTAVAHIELFRRLVALADAR